MVKEYYLLYGAQNVTIDEFGQLIGRDLGMKIELRSSSYLGEYVKCFGPQADHLTVQPNEVAGEIIEEKFSEYPVLIYVSNTKGKNVDKEQRTIKIKEIFQSLPQPVLLKETTTVN